MSAIDDAREIVCAAKIISMIRHYIPAVPSLRCTRDSSVVPTLQKLEVRIRCSSLKGLRMCYSALEATAGTRQDLAGVVYVHAEVKEKGESENKEGEKA